MYQCTFKRVLSSVLAIGAICTSHAQMAQDPLLSHSASVESNIVFMFDDSASMPDTYLYQYGGIPDANGMPGPGTNSYSPYSPDVNRLYYDPRKTYPRRINADGSYQPAGSISGISSFNVYFYNPSSTSKYSVSGVTVNSKGSGYPASGVTATFTAAPAGGSTATVSSVNMVSSSTAQSVTMTSKGSGYPATGVTATFSAPAAGGVQATGTVTMGTSSSVNTVAVNSGGSGYPVSGVTAAFSPAPGAGGAPATATVSVTPGMSVKSVTLNPATGGCGNGYASGPTVTFSAPPSGGVRALGTVTTTGSGSNRKIATLTVTNPGSGYTSAPTVTFSGTPTTACIATAVMSSAYAISAITVTSGGSGYSGTPVLVLSNTGSGSGATFTVTTASTNVVTGVNMTNVGSGYTSTPTVSFSASSGSGASATVTPGSTYGIGSITVGNAGSGYLIPPVLTLANYGSGTGATWTINTNVTTVPGVNMKWDGVGSPTSLSNFFNPSYLPDAGSPLASGSAAGLTYPNSASSATVSYPKFRDRTDCGATSCSWAQEQQNYANWKAYHSNRLDLAKTGIGLAFQGQPATFRLGWGTINTIANSSQLDAGVRLYDSATQTAFFNWLYARAGNIYATPNRIALDKVGQYYKRVDDSGPWANSPPIGAASVTSTGAEGTGHASCRRSYALLMTDGYYNDNFTLADVDTSTATAITSPTSYQYVPIGPYSDNAGGTKVANTFADVAMKYWVSDLRPNLANNVVPTSNDLAYWQHLNFYAVGLGLNGTLDANNPQTLSGLTGTASTRTINWPTPQGSNPLAIDDMWHATINGHGQMFNVNTASDLSDAIGRMLTDATSTLNDQAGVAVSTGIQLSTTTKKYTPLYDRQFWTGDVKASNILTNGTSTPWEVETHCGGATEPTCPSPIIAEKPYVDLIPSAGSRNIFVGNGATSGTRAVPFTYSGMGSLTNQMSGTVTSALVDYLRGDSSNENLISNASVSSAVYRVRPNKLGDIVNSTPVFVTGGMDTSQSPPVGIGLNLKYDQLPSGTPGQGTYASFVGVKNTRKEGVLIVGANDGMLHVFRDGTGASQPGGIETFAYVPNALLPTLNQLANPAYGTSTLPHRYYVDGPNVETDAYINGAWANMVLGSTGDGAGVASSNGVSPRTAVFAIDTTSLNTGVTNSSGTPYMNASSVLWEISSTTAGFGELGYMLNDIQAGPTLDGSWVAIFGNGYESASCHAQLFVVNLQNGNLIKRIDTGVGSGDCTSASNTSRNGLGGVRIVRNDKQQIIGAYAGDLLGNLWKFNLNDSNPANWGVDLGGVPLYKAKDAANTAQPITAPPSVITLPVVWTPAATPTIGYMVVVGTGKFFELGDISTTGTQSLYGIWDPVGFGVIAAAYAGVPLSNNSSLVQQTFGSAQAGTGASAGNTYYGQSSNIVCYAASCSGTPTPTPNRRGWQINLPSSGERMIYPMEILTKRFVSVGTMSPTNVSSLDPCKLTSAGTAFTNIVDALSGTGPGFPIFDTNGDGVVNSSDLTASRYQQQTADGRHVTMLIPPGTGTSCTPPTPPSCPAGSKAVSHTDSYANIGGMSAGYISSCITSWTCSTVPVSGIKTREWRQLFMR